MSFIKKLFGGNTTHRGALFYKAIASASRAPLFYTDYGVADTLDGRFDMLLLVQSLAVYDLIEDGETELVRAMQEMMIKDMDRALREMGVGDLSVGKQIKAMGSALIGRQKSYHDALNSETPVPNLKGPLARNLYRSEDAAKGELAGIALNAERLAPVVYELFQEWRLLSIDDRIAGLPIDLPTAAS